MPKKWVKTGWIPIWVEHSMIYSAWGQICLSNCITHLKSDLRPMDLPARKIRITVEVIDDATT